MTTQTSGAVVEGPAAPETTLRFNEGNHSYRLDGKPVPGVTTLIKGGLPNDSLMFWSARTVAEWVADNPAVTEQMEQLGGRGPLVAFLKAVPWQKRDDAGVRGTAVHALAEEIVHGREVEVPEHLAAHVQGYVDWLDKWQLEPVLTERSVGHRRHWYAGRFDLVGDIAGVRWLLDIKTSKGVYAETALQCAAYRGAEFFVDDDGREQPMPEGIERLGVLHVTDTGTTLVPLRSDDEPYKDFLHAAFLTRRAKQRKAYVLDALHTPKDLENIA